MTKSDIKLLISEVIKSLSEKNSGIATEQNYQMGVISGMIKAFVLSGVINITEAREIHTEILEDEF